MALLEAHKISVVHGQVRAVRGVSLRVDRGEALAVLGRNGAGKTSLLMALAGGVRAAAGQVFWRGRDLTVLPPHERVRAGIALVPEGRRIFPRLTVEENLRLGGFWQSNREFGRSAEEMYALFPMLAGRRGDAAGLLSGGQQQMLALARALVSRPQLLLLDEPSLGLAPLVVDEVYAKLDQLRASGIAMILVEQQVRRALRFASMVHVLHLGESVFFGAPEKLVADDTLLQAYLGKHDS